MKKMILGLALLATCSINAGGFGDTFAGTALGSTVGTAVGTSISRPREKTVIVEGEGYSRGEVRGLKRQVNELQDQLDELEDENAQLRKEIKKLKRSAPVETEK